MQKRGFTLIELLVVVSIVVLLIALLMPALSRTRFQAVVGACASNMRQVGSGVATYAVDSQMHLPTVYRTGSAFTTYWIKPNKNEYVNLGLLYDGGYMRAREAYYCPWHQNTPQSVLRLDGPQNLWESNTVRSSYPARLLQTPEGGVLSSSEKGSWRISNYSDKVIYSEYIGLDEVQTGGVTVGKLLSPHDAEGFNRVFGDGAVAWLSYDALGIYPTSSPSGAATYLLAWQQMDLQR